MGRGGFSPLLEVRVLSKSQVPSAAEEGQPGEGASFSLACASSDRPNLSKNDMHLRYKKE